jgi:hypothetical protein
MANRKISDLTALTAPATGDLLPIVDISEAAAADKNKKITYGELLANAPAGSAAAPSISFTSDPNTGIYSPGADQVAIASSGTGRLFVNSSGNVGIGTSAPLSNFHIAATGECKLIIGNEQTNTDGIKRSAIIKKADNNLEIRATESTVASETIFTRTTSAESARTDSSGRLLVGTSSDSGGALFQVNGDRIRVGTAKTPASASATGTAGEICWDASYIYVCTTTNTWKRTAITTW